MPYLQHIMSWNTIISPLIFRIIIAGFTFQNRKCPQWRDYFTKYVYLIS